jgi:hypothetical protein
VYGTNTLFHHNPHDGEVLLLDIDNDKLRGKDDIYNDEEGLNKLNIEPQVEVEANDSIHHDENSSFDENLISSNFDQTNNFVFDENEYLIEKGNYIFIHIY